MAKQLGIGSAINQALPALRVSSASRDSRRLAIGLSLASMFVAIFVLIAWAMRFLPFIRLVPGMSAISAMTATGFLIASGAIIGIVEGRRDRWTYKTGMALGIGLLALSTAEFIKFEFASGRLDTLVASSAARLQAHAMPTNDISPNTCITFFALACGILLVDTPFRPKPSSNQRRPYQLLACFVALEGVITFIGEGFGVAQMRGFSGLIGAAIQTSTLFVLLGVSLLLARPDRGIAAVILSDTLPGRSARRLLPVAIIAPIALGSVTLMVIRLHSPNAMLIAFGIIVLSMMLLATGIWSTIMALYRQVQISQSYERKIAALEKSRIENALHETEGRLEVALTGAGLGTWRRDIISGKFNWSDECSAMYDQAGKSDTTYAEMLQYIHPDDRAIVDTAARKAIEQHADYAVEYRTIWRDESVHWISVRGRPVYAPAGTPILIEGIAQDVTIQRAALQRQQLVLRDVLSSVTDGRLIMCLSHNELPDTLDPISKPVPLSMDSGMPELRHFAREAGSRAGLSQEQRMDLETAVGEAAMNAVVHASFGWGQVYSNETGTVQVWIEDGGSGIALENLPKATLKRGYTTAGTLGHGMKLMIQTVDRLYLLTGSEGTTVVLEKDAVGKSTAVF